MKKNPAYTGAAAEEREYEIVAVQIQSNAACEKVKLRLKKQNSFLHHTNLKAS